MLAEKTHSRPSAIYAIKNDITAYCFDRAVHTFGAALESRLREVQDSEKNAKMAASKADRELQRWLSSADPEGPAGAQGQQFRDPFAEGMTGHARR